MPNEKLEAALAALEAALPYLAQAFPPDQLEGEMAMFSRDILTLATTAAEEAEARRRLQDFGDRLPGLRPPAAVGLAGASMH
jgi:hypothetical protein